MNAVIAYPRPAFRRGVVTIMAAGLIAFVAMAVTAMVWRLGHESSNFRGERRSSQLRQLLLAGAVASPGLIVEQKESLTVPPPPSLLDRQASIQLRLMSTGGDLEQFVRVEAGIDGGATMAQTLRYVRGSGGWGLAEATLVAASRNVEVPFPKDP